MPCPAIPCQAVAHSRWWRLLPILIWCVFVHRHSKRTLIAPGPVPRYALELDSQQIDFIGIDRTCDTAYAVPSDSLHIVSRRSVSFMCHAYQRHCPRRALVTFCWATTALRDCSEWYSAYHTGISIAAHTRSSLTPCKLHYRRNRAQLIASSEQTGVSRPPIGYNTALY